jgi:hypothetical protein
MTAFRTSRVRTLPAVILAAAALQLSGCALLIAGAAAGGAAGTVASVDERDRDYGPATYAGTVLANVVYFPAKVLFAAAGATASGITYLATLGDDAPSRSIWNAAVTGDYVVTPSMIAGYEDADFVGSGA